MEVWVAYKFNKFNLIILALYYNDYIYLYFLLEKDRKGKCNMVF